MRRNTTATAWAIACVMLAAAPAEPTTGLAVRQGFRAGLVSADMQGAGADRGLTPRTGFGAGVFVTVPLGGALSAQPELLYTQKGAEIEAGANPYEYDFSYIELPVLCKLTLPGRSALFRSSLYAGPSVSLKVGAQKETYFTRLVPEYEEDYADRYEQESVEEGLALAREIDAGYVIGIGAERTLGPGVALLDLRFGRSLASAYTEGAQTRHSTISILFGYALD